MPATKWLAPLALALCLPARAQPQPAATSRSRTAIAWDKSTLHLVAERGSYGRVIPLKSGAWLAGFTRRGGVFASASTDHGATWTEAVRVGGYAKGSVTNSELLELPGGRVMYMFNQRERGNANEKGGTGEIPGEIDNGIAISFSSDAGKTWDEPKRICGGGPMWEPAAVQLPSGEIRLYFADEKPFPKTDEQQISQLTSADAGKTWTGPARASFRDNHRDGMPVPALLASGKLVIAIEDNGLSGTFKPVLVDVTDPAHPVGGKDPLRWSALTEPLPAKTYAGAPYLVRVGNATVLSSQQSDAANKRKMAVWQGNADAKDFGNRTEPFQGLADEGTEQLWNALMRIDDQTVLAIAGARVNGRQGIWTIEGKLPR